MAALLDDLVNFLAQVVNNKEWVNMGSERREVGVRVLVNLMTGLRVLESHNSPRRGPEYNKVVVPMLVRIFLLERMQAIA